MPNKTLSITMFATSYPRFSGDGAAPFIRSIAEGLQKRGHLVEVVAPYDPLVAPVAETLVKVHRFKYAPKKAWHIMGHARAMEADVQLKPLAYLLLPLFLLSALFTLLQVTIRQKAHIIYAHWVLPGGLVAALASMLLRIPFILSLHGSDIYIAEKNLFFRAAAKFVLKRAAFISACSPELREKALLLGASKRSFILPYGVDLDLFRPQTNLPPHPLTVVSSGRLVYKKGFGKLIEAFKIVLAQYPQAHLSIAGEGPLLNELTEKTRSLGVANSITLTGAVSWNQMSDFLHTADVFALPSIHDSFGNVDGLPNVLLEAMSSGIPVVASNVGGVSLVVRDGETGILIPEDDIEALAAGILRLFRNEGERQLLGSQARAFIVKNTSWDLFCKKIEDLSLGIIATAHYKLRMGTLYRDGLIENIQDDYRGSVLDVGCHDGYFLSRLPNEFKVGIDPFLAKKGPGIPFSMIKADGVVLPFRSDAFDTVYALDVIEHVEQDREFVHSLCRVLKPGGKILLTTPSDQIQMVPAFLTHWISLKWGHHLRIGYSPQQLHDLFPSGMDVRVSPWNAPWWRIFYLPLRFAHAFLPSLTAWILNSLADWDAHFRQGNRGYWIVEGIKK